MLTKIIIPIIASAIYLRKSIIPNMSIFAQSEKNNVNSTILVSSSHDRIVNSPPMSSSKQAEVGSVFTSTRLKILIGRSRQIKDKVQIKI